MAEEPQITTLGDVLNTKQRYRDRLADLIGEDADVELLSFMAEGGELRADLAEEVSEGGDRQFKRVWKAFIDDCSRFYSELRERAWLFFLSALSLPLTPPPPPAERQPLVERPQGLGKRGDVLLKEGSFSLLCLTRTFL